MIQWIQSKILRRYKTVSFDVFDTLIERDVSVPTDIFKITGDMVLGEGRGECFQTDRISAEIEARRDKPNGECTLEEIYACLDGQYDDRVQALMNNEITIELKHCRPRKRIMKLFQACLERGQEVYIISDMYLSGHVIEGMLNACGIVGYKKLFVSNEYKKHKRGGQLFSLVLETENLDGGKMIHVGDSLRADVMGARQAGIHSMFIMRRNMLCRFIKMWLQRIRPKEG